MSGKKRANPFEKMRPGPLINLKLFKETWRNLTKPDEGPLELEEAGPTVDLGLEEVKILTPFEQIEAAIAREVGKEENKTLLSQGFGANAGALFLLEHAEVPSHEEMTEHNNASLHALREKAERKINKNQILRKEINYLTSNMLPTPETFEPVDKDEVVLSIAFYHSRKPIKLQEYLVLGSQPLTALRDMLGCSADTVLEGEQTRSAMMFIENVFYNDMRDENNIDYSRPIIEWSNERLSQGLDHHPPYTALKMEETRFIDLSLRENAQYLFVHQGNCEHIIVVSDIRMVTSMDNQNKHAYPLQTFQNKLRRKKCKICDIYPADWVTFGDSLSDENPCFYCNGCYRPLHYTFEGKLLYQNYEVYPFLPE